MPIDSGSTPTGTLGTDPKAVGSMPQGEAPTGGTMPTAITDAEILLIAKDYEATGKLPADVQPIIEKYGIVVNDYGTIFKCYDPVTRKGRWGPSKELCAADIAMQNLRREGKM
jgi:hypothetical protein